MKPQKKRTNTISPLVKNNKIIINKKTRNVKYKNIVLLIYLVIAILSIMNHDIANLKDFMMELLVYSGLGIVLNMIIKNVSITQFKKNMKMLFG